VQRDEVVQLLADNPGLKSRIGEALVRAFRRARLEAAAETDLKPSLFPPELPYTQDEMMERDFPLD
jgi:hypothetical protein